MRTFTAALGAILLACFAGAARADLITFEDLNPGPGSQIANGYHGLNWSNFYAIDGTATPPGSGYDNGSVSGTNVGFNGYGEASAFSDGLFTFNDAYFTAAWNNGLSVTVKGFNGVTELYSVTFTVNTTGPTYEAFGWTGIDSVTFSSSGGTDAGLGGGGEHFAIDNVNVTIGSAVPEPTTLLLTGLGVVGATLKRRKRSKALTA